MKFWSDEEFKDERGAIIIERVYRDTDHPDLGALRYLGKGIVMLDTPMGKMPQEFTVDIDADNIKEAFEEFDTQMSEKAPAASQKAAEEVMNEIKMQMQEQSSSIITPDQIRRTAQFDPNIRG